MWFVALCHDVENGGAMRSTLFAAHVAHNIAHIGTFLFTGPLANADGSSGVGDDPRLRGSIYCIEASGLEDVRRVMEADPFMQGAWRQVDYYRWQDPAGAWLNPAQPPRRVGPDFRCYVAVASAPLTTKDALIGGAVAFLGSTGVVAEPAATVAILNAESMAEAAARAAGADWVANAPIAIGRWVGIASKADLPNAAA